MKAYIPKRLKDIIQKTAAYKVSLLCAPHGFGKSTLVLDYTKKLDANVIYLTLCYGGFESFCLLLCDAAFAENSEKADYYIKMAFKTPAVKKRFVHDVCKAAGGRETVFIIENYHLAMSKEANRLILDLSSEPFERIRFILISDKMCFKSDDINIMTKRVFMINSFNLSLTFDEIIGFCRFQGYCHTETHARKIMADTGGFIAPMKISGGSVSELPELMYRLLEPLYETISEDGKKLMLYLSPYSSFTEEAARFFLGRKSYRDVIDELCEKTALIAYDPASGNYKIHPALLTFCDKKILKIANSPAIFKKNGDWQVLNKNYKMAADFFIKARDYKSLMQAIEAGGFIFSDKSVLYKIYSETPKKTMIKYPYAILWLAAGFLAFGERNTVDEALRLFREGLLTCKDLKKEKMLAFCEFLLAFDPLAEFEDVKRHLVNAINFSCGKTIEEIKSLPAVLGAPTASEIFYKRGDFSDTAKSLCKLEGLFRSLGEGFRTGLGKCARAESMYMQGDFEKAEIFLHGAIREVSGDMLICALFLDGRIALAKGDVQRLKKDIEGIFAIGNNKNYLKTADICMAFFNLITGRVNETAQWLISGEFGGIYPYMAPSAYAVCLLSLLAKKKYTYLLSLHDSARDCALRMKNKSALIYINLSAAAANTALGMDDTAERLLSDAFLMAEEGKIIMPFVECNIKPAELMEDKTIDSLISSYNKAASKIQDTFWSDIPLTKRELEIARLAAKGLQNSEIAEELFVSVNTIKSALKSVFSKLDIYSRREIKKKLDEYK